LRPARQGAIGDTITATAREAKERHVTFDCECSNQRGEVVISGSAKVIAPTDKVKRPRTILPDVYLHQHGAWYQRLLTLSSRLEPIRTAVVHPVDGNALPGAIQAAKARPWVAITIR